MNRRDFIRGLSFGTLGLSLPELLSLRAGAATAAPIGQASPAKARSCIMIFLFGGPSHIDTWDMKPAAPDQ